MTKKRCNLTTIVNFHRNNGICPISTVNRRVLFNKLSNETHSIEDTLEVKDEPNHTDLGDNMALIQVYSASINPVDYKVLKGHRWGNLFPFYPGYDFAGKIVKLNDKNGHLKVGQRVFGVNWGKGRHNSPDVPFVGGTFSQYCPIRVDMISALPDEIDYNTGAAIPLIGTTAYQSLFQELDLQPHEKILILGGSSAVGTIAIQLAKLHGSTVYTTCSSRSMSYVKQYHPDKIIDYNQYNCWEMNECHGIDVILDTIGLEKTFQYAKNILKKDGKFLSISSLEAGMDKDGHPPLRYAANFVLSNNRLHQDYLMDLIVKKKLHVPIEEIFEFNHPGIIGLYKKIASGKSLGKNIIQIVKE